MNRELSRRWLAAAFAFVLAAVGADLAAADEHEAGGPQLGGGITQDADGNGGYDLDLQVDQTLPGEAVASGGTPGVTWIAIPVPGTSGDPEDGNQGVCRDVTFVEVDVEEAAELRQRAEADYFFYWNNIPELMELNPNVPCPIDPADDLPAALVEDSIRAVINDQLPRPTLELPPGFALAGLRTYLITDHELTHELTTDVDLQIVRLDVSITATGTSTVDWGDGTVDTYDHGADRGHPDGPINHVYTDVDTVDITVTDTWTITYTAGPISGTFEAPLAPVTLPDIEIQERRAVRTS